VTYELELLYLAIESERGIVVEVSDSKADAQKLYRARSDSGDPKLKELKIHRSPTHPDTQLWIVKNAKERV
jgi:hypothetical protein